MEGSVVWVVESFYIVAIQVISIYLNSRPIKKTKEALPTFNQL